MIGIIIVAALAMALIILNVVASSLNQELESIRTGNEIMVQRIDALKPVEKLLNDVGTLTALVAVISDVSPEWEAIVPEVGNVLPPDVYLTSLTAGYSEGAGTLVITGRAPDYERVSGLMGSLSELDGLGEITCKFSAADSADGNIQFQLSIPIDAGVRFQAGGGSQ